jgi:hypothetical protein
LPKARSRRQTIKGGSETRPAWTPDLRFSFQRTARDGGRIRFGGATVAEIRRLELVNFRPARGAAPLVGAEVGVPLFWRQYGNHQDPERSANSHRRLTLVAIGPDGLRLDAQGATRSRSIASRMEVTFRADGRGAITCEVQARLEVAPGPGWLVTPHPDHGEVTFCTLWPAGVFSPDGRAAKRFQACLTQRGDKAERIEHHHLESPDKHHIRLGVGDRFAWVLEDANPVITIGPGRPVEAGVCAYMWDTHFGVNVCPRGRTVTLPPGTVLQAAYTIGSASRMAMNPLVKRSRLRSAGAAAGTPMWTGGRHSFRETFRRTAGDRNTAWPWQTAVTAGAVQNVDFARDTRTGCTDRYSLRINHRLSAKSCWQATTLGPAFGEPAFRRGGRLQLRAKVRARGLHGQVQVALRLHRTGRGSVFEVAGYEVFASPAVRAVDQDWVELTVTTPAISPAPDRVHVLLQFHGRGTVWFDDVEFERLSDQRTKPRNH